jgi:protein SCO1/2|tara:strand:+ start:10187 stop:10858 length:672 start_codon:yes stop_codon:yes gene_type:complete
MTLSQNAKIGLVVFVVFDALLAIALVSLYLARSERELLTELREIGVTVYPQPIQLSEFELTDQFGNPFTEENLSGYWSILFLGYTNCPDICPLTMAELKQFYQRLDDPEIKDDLRIVLVSVDAERDTPETMANYVNSFNREFIGLSGDYDSISKLASQVFVAHSVAGKMPDHSEHADDADAGYLIEHSSHLTIFNEAGQLQAIVRQPVRDRDLLRAYRLLREK